MGHVILVTLAKEGWVKESCKNFCPALGKVVEELKIPVVYAQTGIKTSNEFKTVEEFEKFWAGIKGDKIKTELAKFYSQYKGQSWKNIISVGDSNFERLGTMGATQEYQKQVGLTAEPSSPTVQGKVGGHFFKVRTKTFKMIDDPTVQDLTMQLAMLHRWLPLMVSLDAGFDVNLDKVDNPAKISEIEGILRGDLATSNNDEWAPISQDHEFAERPSMANSVATSVASSVRRRMGSQEVSER
eukprot:gnl/TRDRNA2_/TRDRNA2_168238_c0_seq1.p1 gnl/TRDRNA2_/TRDRNA2_168238_c0~~gnl/TRDRNA2_/TRDRNA2_168238_c0_seq1.p1  ORF type:complete len:270 (+),score=47.97 gnl/TRDRNA2_/TRDRNA2_168238_c0_seq1:86-811(+)